MSYRFSTAAQWNACEFERADRDSSPIGLRPFAPFATPPVLFRTAGAHAPAITRTGEILWRDDAGALHRLGRWDDVPDTSPAPAAIARAERIVATSRGLWVASDRPVSVQLYEEDTLTRLLTVPIPDPRILDITGDGRGGVYALVERGAAHVSGAAPHVIPSVSEGPGREGRVTRAAQPPGPSLPLGMTRIAFLGIAHPIAFVFLRRAERFVVLTDERPQRLHWFPAQGGAALLSITLATLRPCFTAHVLGTDSTSRVFVAGADEATFGGAARVLSLDGDGRLVGDVPLDPLDAPATGVAAARDKLVVTGRRGLLRFTTAATVPDEAGEVRSAVVTPVLHAPDREDARRWLRIEASASLPPGSTIEISFAASDDAEDRERVWRAPVVFHGGESPATPFVAPLFDIRERFLRVRVALSAAPGARLPELSELAVLYPGRTLMENLPGIYQRAEAQPGSFLRSLVGVLETTTQGLDARIAALGSLAHPSTAPEEWLDFVARWLGLPWDDGLALEQKKAILGRAPELARGRGTRAGLEALLGSLIPGTPRRFRVTDATADFGFATVGGDGCTGSALPAMLGGFTRWSAELDERAVLGFMRLPCPGQVDDGTFQLAGKVRVEIAATAEERAAWEPWLLALITEMVPLTARVDLRWVVAQALRRDRLGDPLTLEEPPAPLLGTGAVTGLARLPEGGARLSGSGPDIGTRLR